MTLQMVYMLYFCQQMLCISSGKLSQIHSMVLGNKLHFHLSEFHLSAKVTYLLIIPDMIKLLLVMLS